jgi:hypothetical protein
MAQRKQPTSHGSLVQQGSYVTSHTFQVCSLGELDRNALFMMRRVIAGGSRPFHGWGVVRLQLPYSSPGSRQRSKLSAARLPGDRGRRRHDQSALKRAPWPSCGYSVTVTIRYRAGAPNGKRKRRRAEAAGRQLHGLAAGEHNSGGRRADPDSSHVFRGLLSSFPGSDTTLHFTLLPTDARHRFTDNHDFPPFMRNTVRDSVLRAAPVRGCLTSCSRSAALRC